MSNHYTFRVIWSVADGEYVGLCSEFPSLSWLEPTPEEAFSGIRQLVKQVVGDMLTTGEDIPIPFADRK